MGQTTLDDDDLFDEAASEMREDVEESLGKAREALPEGDAIWDVDADNTLGVLNGLRSALDPGEAEDHLTDAKKWYTMGERADAFEDADDLAEEIETLDEVFADIEDAHEQVSDLASTVPELRGALDDAHAAAEDDAEGDAEAEADAEAEEAEAAD
ncbi:hypothetical protein BV210_06930 [Halorientalis sp. IM1011]|jgi:hypothetical protein|uniref:DUF5790 family protein n=1 Tax=Halorientalis sp. IM1011 TaxID=1932360 RepID=UPI00097CD1D8|nr:DUF5790 family protein [Halorientalis sp. IM1011]AQL42462.1 hypothetical protein BV210_06930 [Halorientalis sp. IM1011]